MSLNSKTHTSDASGKGTGTTLILELMQILNDEIEYARFVVVTSFVLVRTAIVLALELVTVQVHRQITNLHRTPYRVHQTTQSTTIL